MLELLEDPLFAQVFDGILARGTSQSQAQLLVLHQAQDRCVQRGGVLGRHGEAAAFDDLCDLGARVRGGGQTGRR